MFGTDSPCDSERLNNAFVDATQYINPVIADRSKLTISLWRGMIPRGNFRYGEGYIKKTQTFYGDTGEQDAGASWVVVEASRPPNPETGDLGHDSCRYESAVVGYGFEEKSYQLRETTRRTFDICLSDIQFKWQYEKQLAMIFKSLANVTLSEWEQWEREVYIDFANKWVASNSSTSDIGLGTWATTLGSGTITIPAGGLDAIGTLTQPVLDRIYMYLERQARAAAIGSADGMPQFGLVTSPESSTDIIRQDAVRDADMRYVRPNFLVEGFGTVRAYQGYGHIHDIAAPRYKVNDTGTALERVWPFMKTATTIGNAVNVDPEYIKAPFEVSIVFLKDVYRLLVPPPNPSSIAGAYKFDPADNFGEFHWINGWDRCENILREKGFFFGRYRSAAEPLEYSNDAVAILHRRCNALDLSFCFASDGACTATAVTTCAKHTAADEDDDATVYDLVLADDLGCGVGEQVQVAFTGGATLDAIIVSDDNTPEYVVAFAAGVAGGHCAYDTGMATVQCTTCGAVVDQL